LGVVAQAPAGSVSKSTRAWFQLSPNPLKPPQAERTLVWPCPYVDCADSDILYPSFRLSMAIYSLPTKHGHIKPSDYAWPYTAFRLCMAIYGLPTMHGHIRPSDYAWPYTAFSHRFAFLCGINSRARLCAGLSRSALIATHQSLALPLPFQLSGMLSHLSLC
jgi:hypothetical protein